MANKSIHSLMPNGQPWTTPAEKAQVIANTPSMQAIKASPEYQRAIATRQEAKFTVDVPGRGRLWIHVFPDGHMVESNHSQASSFLSDALTLIPGVTGLATSFAGPANAAVQTGVNTASTGGKVAANQLDAQTPYAGPPADNTITGSTYGNGMATTGPANVTGAAQNDIANASSDPSLSWNPATNSWVRKAVNSVTGNNNGTSPLTAGGVDWGKIIAALASSAPALMANHETPADAALKAQQQRILGLQEQRLNSQQPLFDSTQRGLMAMLPTFMRNGGG